MFRMLLLSLLLVGVSSPALAKDCPALIAEFEAALKTTAATEETKAAAEKLIPQAREQEAAGQDQACVATVEQALAMLAM